MSAHPLIIEDAASIDALLTNTHRIAVLGIKTAAQRDQPAYYVPAYLAGAKLEIIPVPVYYPEATEILGKPVFRSLLAIGKPVDMVDVFRRPQDLAAHVDDLLALRPGSVWFQQGICNDSVALRLAEAGITVVQDRCLMVEHRRWAATQS